MNRIGRSIDEDEGKLSQINPRRVSFTIVMISGVRVDTEVDTIASNA